jgi:hypothetical protein
LHGKLDILKSFAIKEAKEKNDIEYVSFLNKKGFIFPEPSEKFIGSDYEVQAMQALYWTVPKYYAQFAEQRGIFFLANMLFLIESFTKAKCNQSSP